MIVAGGDRAAALRVRSTGFLGCSAEGRRVTLVMRVIFRWKVNPYGQLTCDDEFCLAGSIQGGCSLSTRATGGSRDWEEL